MAFIFCLNNNFETKQFDLLRQSFDWNLISPNISRDVQKPLIDLCMSQIVAVLAGEIWISFSSHRISLCSKSPHFDGANLNFFGCVYTTHAQWSSHFCIWERKAVWFKFVILEPCDQCNQFYLEKKHWKLFNAAPFDGTWTPLEILLFQLTPGISTFSISNTPGISMA